MEINEGIQEEAEIAKKIALAESLAAEQTVQEAQSSNTLTSLSGTTVPTLTHSVPGRQDIRISVHKYFQFWPHVAVSDQNIRRVRNYAARS